MFIEVSNTEEYIFQECRDINSLLFSNKENEARQKLIQLLDFHKSNDIEYSPLVNHLIRETGLYPYIQEENSNWEERYIYNLFKVDVGIEFPITLHREQSLLLKKLLSGTNIAVSAPTSFGKSFVIDAFIKIKKPKNVIILVPTIALTDETRRRIYKKFAGEYKIITTSDVELAEKNIFIFPQERAINYVNKLDYFDILIVDEFYKASKKFDKERSPSLIKAMIKLGNKSRQKYYLAPNISTLEDNPFTKDMEFIHLDFNTVYLQKHELFQEIGKDYQKKGEILVKILQGKNTKTLIYAGTYSNIESISTLVLTNFDERTNNLLNNFSYWLGKNYDNNWQLTQLVKKGTGIHNGQLHRSLSQIQVKLFEEKDGLSNIISTSSIIEGVNTSAENVIIWMNKNGKSKLNDFTYRNIIGRGGRMFKYFVGNIYILDAPPPNEQTQLEIPFPEEILGDLDEERYENILSKEQVAKIKYYQEEMSKIMGESVFLKLKREGVFQSSNALLIKSIATELYTNPNDWAGLGYLNSALPSQWEYLLYKVINLQPGNWDTKNKTFVEFIKIISRNWFKSIPELLHELEPYDVGINDFFKLERNVTFKLSSLLRDINTLQKVILQDLHTDISQFISWTSYAFLPPVVFQLEEYGLPRMISRKLHRAKIINFYDNSLTIHDAINHFNRVGINTIFNSVQFDDFEKYIITYFYDGITSSDVNRTL